MIKIPDVSDENKENFFQNVGKRYIDALKVIKDIPACRKLVDYIYQNGEISIDNVRKIIIGDINELNKIIQIIGKIKKSDFPEVYKCFEKEYSKFTGRNFGKNWSKQIGVKVCPYCNRSYIFTLSKGTRPQYDHFFPKSLYPYLSVSLYNLIPCCPICNNSKTAKDVYQKGNRILYPFEDEYGYDISFRLKIEDEFALIGMADDFTLKVESNDNVDAELKQKVNYTVEKLHIEELYNLHKDYVKNILKKKYIFQDSYCQSLLDSFPDVFSGIDDVKKQLYFNYLSKEEWGEQILSKLTYDILNSE